MQGKVFRSVFFIVAISIISLFNVGGCNNNGGGNNDQGTIEIAIDAYIYGFAPVVVAKTSHDQTRPTVEQVPYAPINELYIDTQISSPDNQLWVSPNANVNYSSAHLDLTEEPMVLFTPQLQDRYFSWQLMDAYTNNFAYIGTRATGGEEGTFAIVGPNWEGELPDGFTRIDSPTNSVWIVSRIEVTPDSQVDLDTAIGIAQASVLLPLDAFINRDPDYVNPIIEKPTIRVRALDISGLNFLYVLNEWLTENPPPPSNNPILRQLAKIGVGPGFTTDFDSLPFQRRSMLLAGLAAGDAILEEQSLTSGEIFSGWLYNIGPDFGNWGTDYFLRSTIARDGLGANINAEAIYPVRTFDEAFRLLNSNNSYTMTFRPEDLPVPINPLGFWSLTMYDRASGQLVNNPIDRYTIGSQNNLVTSNDGSITIYIQRDNPGGEMENNWLPSPQNNDTAFYMLFRAYYPDDEMFMPFSMPDYILPEVVNTDIP